jgi:hypothetical protein
MTQDEWARQAGDAMKIDELSSRLGDAIGNLQNMVGAVELTVPRPLRKPYLQDRLRQAKEFLDAEREPH